MNNHPALKREDVAETAEYFTQYVMNGLDKLVTVSDLPQPEDYEKPPPPTESDLPF